MRKLWILAAALTLLLATAAIAGPRMIVADESTGLTGEAWDDSHMRTRHAATPLPKTRPPIVVGEAESRSRLEGGTLPEATWHSWAKGGQSIRFGKLPPRQISGGGGLASGRSGSGGGGGSLGGFRRGAAR